MFNKLICLLLGHKYHRTRVLPDNVIDLKCSRCSLEAEFNFLTEKKKKLSKKQIKECIQQSIDFFKNS